MEGELRCDAVDAANLAETTKVDKSSSAHATARNIGCFDPFSNLQNKGISVRESSAVIIQFGVRDHRILGGRPGIHCRRTARTGLFETG